MTSGAQLPGQPEERQLRDRLRALMKARLPDDFVGSFTGDATDLDTAAQFCRELAAEKLLCMAWPREYGGQEAGPWLQTIVREEMWAHYEPRGAQYMGVNWVGPAIMRHGTADQKRAHLGRISSGEVIWCQGFSEPDAGSDLSALRTLAVSDGDCFRITGQKVWTSYAPIAQWCFLLARTERNTDDLRAGITVFLVPTDSPGFTIRPLAALVGPFHLNEMFLSDVVVPNTQVLGEVGRGWRIVMEVLAYERLGIARYAKCERLLSEVRTALDDSWDDVPGALRDRWTRGLIRSRLARLLAYRVVDMQARERVDPADVAAYRIAVTELDQEVSEILTEIAGPEVFAPGRANVTLLRAIEDHWRYAAAGTVSSGTIEMQRRALAKAVMAR